MNTSMPSKILLLVFLPLMLCASIAADALAKKGGNGQSGNGGDGGGNDTPDPEYVIAVDPDADNSFTPSAPVFNPDESSDPPCAAFNPDLKGPGIAYGGFYPRNSDCAQALTDTGLTLYVHRLYAVTDGNGDIVAFGVGGREAATGFVFEGFADISPQTPAPPPPADDLPSGDFTLTVDSEIVVNSCDTAKLKGNTVCDRPIGSIAVADVHYVVLGL
jgi:hypothetical protein